MSGKRWLYFALGLTAVISIGAVTNQLVPLAPATGLELSESGITFPDGTEQTTSAGHPDPPCFNTTQRFVDCGNGTVTDTLTGLIYLKNANCFGEQDWPTANQSAAGLAHGACGLTDSSRAGDWRLPTLDEWKTIVTFDCRDWPNNPAIVGNGTPSTGCYGDNAGANAWATNVPLSDYWSSTPLDDDTTKVWIAGLSDARFLDQRKQNPDYVWPVRGGQ